MLALISGVLGRGRKGTVIAALASCVALVVAGCGGSSEESKEASVSGSSSTAAQSSSTQSAAAGSGGSGSGTVKLMVIAPVNNPIQSFPSIEPAAKVAADEINAEGGIKGEKVEILFCNTASEVNKAKDCAREAVQQHVAAVVGQIDIFTTQDVPILQQAGIPDVGLSSNGNPIAYQSPDVFPLQAGTLGSYVAQPVAAKQVGKHSIAVAAANVPSALVDAEEIEKVAKEVGVKYTGTVEVPDTGVSDYSPYAQKIASGHPEAVVNILSPAPDLGILKSAQSIGLTPQWMNVTQAFGEQEASQAGGLGEGMLIASPFPSVRSTQYPLIKTFDEQMEAHGISPQETAATTYPHWMLGINGWLSVWAVDKAAQSISGPLTASSLTSAMNKETNLELPGGFKWSPATPGPKGFPRVSNWTQYFITIKNGKEETVSSIKPVNGAKYVVAVKGA